MKRIQWIAAALVGAFLIAGTTFAAEQKPAKKLTCCEKAAAEGKECANKCCITAHRQGKSCEKCNPNKEDLALLKKKDAKAGRK